MPTARTAIASQRTSTATPTSSPGRARPTAPAQWADLDGAANQEIFDRFVEAEFRTDWEATVARFGEHATKALCRAPTPNAAPMP